MNDSPDSSPAQNPLKSLEEWDDYVRERYTESGETATSPEFATVNPNKKKEEFRNYQAEARACVREFYRQNHAYQTRDFVLEKKKQYLPKQRAKMGIWEAMQFLNTLVDDSDPDTDLSQIEHLLQTSEAARQDGRPPWFVLAALIHDLGKILCLWGEPQWAVVGDTFPVGCAWSEKIVFHEFFAANPDASIPQYQARNGIYREGCGLDSVDMSWGHDEYVYHVAREYLPEEAHYMLRYHSFYPAHREGEYEHLMSAHDREMFYWVREFNQYDLYSKSAERPDAEKLRPFYENLIADYFPAQIGW
jgi:inositol oxygenase